MDSVARTSIEKFLADVQAYESQNLKLSDKYSGVNLTMSFVPEMFSIIATISFDDEGIPHPLNCSKMEQILIEYPWQCVLDDSLSCFKIDKTDLNDRIDNIKKLRNQDPFDGTRSTYTYSEDVVFRSNEDAFNILMDRLSNIQIKTKKEPRYVSQATYKSKSIFETHPKQVIIDFRNKNITSINQQNEFTIKNASTAQLMMWPQVVGVPADHHGYLFESEHPKWLIDLSYTNEPVFHQFNIDTGFRATIRYAGQSFTIGQDITNPEIQAPNFLFKQKPDFRYNLYNGESSEPIRKQLEALLVDGAKILVYSVNSLHFKSKVATQSEYDSILTLGDFLIPKESSGGVELIAVPGYMIAKRSGEVAYFNMMGEKQVCDAAKHLELSVLANYNQIFDQSYEEAHKQISNYFHTVKQIYFC